MNLSAYLSIVLLFLAFANGAKPKFNLLPRSVALKDMEQQSTASATNNNKEDDDADS